MYAFPRISFGKKAVQKAKEMGVSPDFMYCMEMVNQTGIMCIPGSGFGQKENEFHFRITNLVSPTERMADTINSLERFNQ